MQSDVIYDLAALEGVTLNEKAVLAAHDQVSARLADLLDIKAAFEGKASTMFGVYITLALTVFGAGANFFGKGGANGLAFGLWAGGIMFVAGAMCFAMVFRQSDYGTKGSHPDIWLCKGVIDSSDAAVTSRLARLVFLYKNRVDTSERSNLKKRRMDRSWDHVRCSSAAVTSDLFADRLSTR